MTNDKTIYEFLLWANCNNNCLFCHQRSLLKKGRFLTQEAKQKSIDTALAYLNSDKFKDGSHVMLCGGELFDNPEDKAKLTNLFYEIAKMMRNDKIDRLFLNTNLIYEDNSILLRALALLSVAGCLDRVNFTTSYDLKGRFLKERSKELFDFNLKYISGEFPNLNVITNIIMTKDLCNAVLSDAFSLAEFSNEYHTYINLLPYITLGKDLQATKEEVVATIRKANEQIPGYIERYKANMKSNPERYVFEFTEKDGLINSTADNGPCGHSINFTKVFDDDTCFLCHLNDLL